MQQCLCGWARRTGPVEKLLQADRIQLPPDIAHAVSRNSSGTRPESLEVVEAVPDCKSQYASHAARPTSAQYVRRGAPPGSVASDDVVVFMGDAERGERGDHTLLSAGANAGVLVAGRRAAGCGVWTPPTPTVRNPCG